MINLRFLSIAWLMSLLFSFPARLEAQFNHTTKAGAINALPVTSIGDSAFSNQGGITGVTYPGGLAGSTVFITQPPVISVQPAGQTVVAGVGVTFNVGASGTAPLQYQWLFQGTNLPAAQNSTLTIGSAQTTNAGGYRVVITNLYGSATSAVATLTVLSLPPAITAQPGNLTLLAGGTATFSVSALAYGALAYDWFRNGTAISGATNTIYTTSAVSAADSGSQFFCVVSDAYGSVTSSVAVLTISDPVITQQPLNRYAALGGQATFSVSAGGTPPFLYQWRFGGTNIPGATNSAFALTNVTQSSVGEYDVIVSGALGSVISIPAYLSAGTVPGSTANPPSNDNFENAVLLSGGSASGNKSNAGATKEPGEPNHANNPGGASVWWAWTAPANGLELVSTTGTHFDTLLAVYTGASVSNLTLVAGDDDGGPARTSLLMFGAVAGTVYHIAVDGYNGASGLILFKLAQVAATPPAIMGEPRDQGAGVGGTAAFYAAATAVPFLPGIILVDPLGTNTGPLSYQWESANGLIEGATNASLILTNLQVSDAGRYDVVVANANGGVTSVGATLAVSTGPRFSTVAGHAPTPGYADALGRGARFDSPGGVAVDSAGNTYVADSFNHAIRKIAPDGTTTTLAGGARGASDGFGTNAAFNFPSGVAVDGLGNVFVADQLNNAIRQITPQGQVITLAGVAVDKNSGFKDGAGPAALFNHPAGVAVDGQGNIYVADTWNNVIRVVSTNGVVTTLAGKSGTQGSTDGVGAGALFSLPCALAVGASNNVYVVDTGNCAIRLVTTNGVVTTLAGNPGFADSADGVGTNAHFAFPEGIAVDGAGNLYIADTGNNTIREVSPQGNVLTVAGQAGLAGATDDAGTNAFFSQPTGVALDGHGNIVVSDKANDSIRKIGANSVVATLAGSGGSAGADGGPPSLALFSNPTGVAVDASTNVYIADLLNSVIRTIAPDGSVSILAGQTGRRGNLDGPSANALFASPIAVAVDGRGRVYVADSDNETIRLISDGVVSTFAGSAGTSGSEDGPALSATFDNPSGVAVDGDGNVYVADAGNQTIRLIATNGMVTTLAGWTNSMGSIDGVGTNATFSNPTALAVDGAGNVYVADEDNATIRKITPAGVVTTLAGIAGRAGSADGPATNATFSGMAGLAVDSAGNVYVADTYNQTVRMISAAGSVTTLGGFAGAPGSVDGLGLGARFSDPAGIAAGPDGRIYVADTLNNTIRATTSGLLAVPVLQAAGSPGGIVLSWPLSAEGFMLQASPSLTPPITWTNVITTPVAVGSSLVVTNKAGNPAGFFRLSKP